MGMARCRYKTVIFLRSLHLIQIKIIKKKTIRLNFANLV